MSYRVKCPLKPSLFIESVSLVVNRFWGDGSLHQHSRHYLTMPLVDSNKSSIGCKGAYPDAHKRHIAFLRFDQAGDGGPEDEERCQGAYDGQSGTPFRLALVHHDGFHRYGVST